MTTTLKHSYSFLAGVVLVSLCVIGTRSLPGYMFLLGFVVCFVSMFLFVRAIGFGKVARLFQSIDSFRFALPWSGSAKQVYAIPSLNPVPGQSKLSHVADGERSEARGRREIRRTVGSPQRSTDQSSETRTLRNHSSSRNAESQSVVQSREMLPQVQQDVMSALINLKVPFADAEQAVRGAAKQHGADSFDDLFKTCMSLINAGVGKSRRAAA